MLVKNDLNGALTATTTTHTTTPNTTPTTRKNAYKKSVATNLMFMALHPDRSGPGMQFGQNHPEVGTTQIEGQELAFLLPRGQPRHVGHVALDVGRRICSPGSKDKALND